MEDIITIASWCSEELRQKSYPRTKEQLPTVCAISIAAMSPAMSLLKTVNITFLFRKDACRGIEDSGGNINSITI